MTKRNNFLARFTLYFLFLSRLFYAANSFCIFLRSEFCIFIHKASSIHDANSSVLPLSAPSGIAVYKGKYLLVCDYSNDCVKICSLEGRVLSSFGSKGDGINQYCGPEALVVTPQGNIVVSDKLNSRIQVFDLVI